MRASTLAVSTRPCFSPRNFNKTGPGDEATPQVMWLKNGASVVRGNGISVTSGMASSNTTTFTLQFNPLHTSNGGQYSCIANDSLQVRSITSLYNTSVYSLTVQSKFVPSHMISAAYPKCPLQSPLLLQPSLLYLVRWYSLETTSL